ncbi:aminotransferase class IV [Cellulomonas chengniuliangii]|uniref:Aminotransferase class IV n=1 Tax=Cellulomonas chengniuliangii TaxID=2968084 RepID=A0ABY5L1T1_9CELL|nr:aminotransferase class IV [Cellulomonas chengniuliangii]MCC2308360.1 aminotransferase class IV [Cellulomonas chengniuliangii]MCC2317377.1 aminotransferase class IV [Cellulomonas chengniuliangii]UUI76742.1 aminotransferase class IV [Cellulomonas chengniuliangii]
MSEPTRPVIWSEGRLLGPDEPLVTAVDHGLTVGDGVFETCGVVRGQAFALTRHLRRLARSARGLGLPAPDEAAVRAGVEAVLAASGPDIGRVRITVTGGPGPLGSQRFAPEQAHPTVIVLGGPAPRSPVARVARVPWVRNERSAVAGLKTTSYAENVVALAEAYRQGADEALLANTIGELCEGTGSNVFVERDGELLTPPLSSGCLAGITRELLLEWSAAEGLPAREAAPGELAYAVLDDVVAGRAGLALSGSVRNVSPVVAVDGRPVEAGALSEAARRLFEERMAQDVDP